MSYEPDDLASARGCVNGVLISAGMIAAAGLALALSTCAPSPAGATPFHIPGPEAQTVETVYQVPARVVLAEIGRE